MLFIIMIGPSKNISVFRLTGLTMLGRVGTHIFFSGKNIISCILKSNLSFKMHKNIFFQENLKKSSRCHQQILVGSDKPKNRYFFIWPC